MDAAARHLGAARPGGGPTLSPRLSADLARALERAHARLTRAYVDAHAARLELAARSMTLAEDWGAARAPRAPRELCLVLLESLEGVVAELAALGPPTDGQRRAGDDVEAAFGRVLADRARGRDGAQRSALRHAHPAPADVCARVAARALRAAAAALREVALPRAGFQQVQLDVHFLRGGLQLLVQGGSEEPAAMQALDDVLAAAMERCSEPVMLEPVVLDRILAGTLDGQRGQAARGWA